MKGKGEKIFVSIYSHPEIYPPTLNAVSNFSKFFQVVYLHYLNVMESDWNYPNNVVKLFDKKFVYWRELMTSSHLNKIKVFLSYTYSLLKGIKKTKSDVVVLYDPISLLAFFLVKNFVSKQVKIWYHNHDVVVKSKVSKFSLLWFAATAEKRCFQYIDVFTLPTNDRKIFFPFNDFKGQYFFLPNYPSLYFYSNFYTPRCIENRVIKLIYQGSVGKGHGLEEIIVLMGKRLVDCHLVLILKGFITREYEEELLLLAKQNHLLPHELQIVYSGPYKSVPHIASVCHIGIGIHSGKDVMNATLGTASNKIYEYAALGLPVLLFDNVQFKDNLGEFDWAFFTDLSEESLISNILAIEDNFEILSAKAHIDFLDKLNFEYYFKKVLSIL